MQGIVEPEFAHFERGEAAIPLAPFPLVCSCSNILYDKGADRDYLTEKHSHSQFPLPASFGRRRESLPALLAILARLTARSVSPSTRAAPLRTVCVGFLDALPGLCLDIEIGMRC